MTLGQDARVEIGRDAEALARMAAAAIAERIVAAVAARGSCSLCLAGGSTPRRTYQLLADPPLREAIPWARVGIFFGDERCVPPDDPDSNYRLARQALLDRVFIPAEQIHRIRGEEADAVAAAAACEAELRAALGAPPGGRPALDLVLLGMGPDGHVASLFPGSEALSETVLLARAVSAPKPPFRRITLTLPALNAARAVLFLVSGAEKAPRVAEVLSGGGADLPAARVRPAGEILWLLDEAAASRRGV